MNCVACNEPMVVLELNEVEIDHCLSCGGIWLDAGEIELLLSDSSEAAALMTQVTRGRNRQAGKRPCPICNKKMDVVSVGAEREVEIDLCRRNHGIWFDRGELKEVLEIFDTDRHSNVHDLFRGIFDK
jgi:Zn-finger nucleic acid-binding protein